MKMLDSEASRRLIMETLAPIIDASRTPSGAFPVCRSGEPGLMAITSVTAAASTWLLVSNESKLESGFLVEIAGAVLIVVDLKVSDRAPCSRIQYAVYRTLVVAEMLQLHLCATDK